ncbi:hypothetical protein [Metabacillus arenae]|uniref:Uncharacterized protein n=1 Tax=Metabacillus arenae TaxID=2771434 RepID=A0A926N998_9BACI|nr:hypothetical protein [Metabacillus arenae]MBD1379094.1 hypothetical protein [Metabacillus arenae]
MANTFEIIGKLSISKESEKFKPYEVTSYPSGWAKSRLLFNVQSAENRHMLTSEGMYKEDGTGFVYSFTKGEVDPTTHERKKGEKIQIPWKDRNKPEVIENIAEFKKLVVDLEKYGRRYELENALEKQEKGILTEEELSKLGVADIKAALEESKKKRKVFLAEYDYTEFLQKLISSGKVDNKLFKVSGDIVWSEYNGKIYKKLVPSRIYLVDDNEPQTSTGLIEIYYNKDSLDTASFETTKKHYVNGFIRNYDNQRKENIACPVQLVIDGSKEGEKVEKFVKIMENQFTVEDDSWKEFGVKVKILDGAQKAEITEDMLTDFQKEMLELEVITMDDIRKELGGDVYGEKVQEMIIVNVSRGFTKGRKDTVYIDSDFEIKSIVNTPEETSNANDEEIGDVLDDLDDLDIM